MCQIWYPLLDPSLQIFVQKSDRGISDFRNSGQFFITENCCNSITSHDTNMKLINVKKIWRWRHVSKLWCHFFNWLMVNLQPFGGRIPNSLSLKLTFSLIVTFILKNLKVELKISNTALILLFWVKSLFLQKKMLIFALKYWYQQTQGSLGTRGYIFWNYIHACTFVSNFKFTPTPKLTPKNPTLIRANPTNIVTIKSRIFRWSYKS